METLPFAIVFVMLENVIMIDVDLIHGGLGRFHTSITHVWYLSSSHHFTSLSSKSGSVHPSDFATADVVISAMPVMPHIGCFG